MNDPRHLILLGTVFLVLVSCSPHRSHNTAAEGLLKVDQEFSKLSEEKGMNTAFLQYIADDAVLLRPNKYPIKGKQKIQEIYNKPDTTFTLTWEPLYADVARSGEIGYTYGIYKFESFDPNGTPLLEKGTYASVWKKDRNGEWKFVLDVGNQGVGE